MPHEDIIKAASEISGGVSGSGVVPLLGQRLRLLARSCGVANMAVVRIADRSRRSAALRAVQVQLLESKLLRCARAPEPEELRAQVLLLPLCGASIALAVTSVWAA